MTNKEWDQLRKTGTVAISGDVLKWDAVLLAGIPHVVHEYANFVSSAKMRKYGEHRGTPLEPPINTHIAHAFLLNCRKMACFFAGPLSCPKKIAGPPPPPKWSDVFAKDYVDKFTATLDHWCRWKDAVDKQLAHITYTRGIASEEIPEQADIAMENEIKTAWMAFFNPAQPLSNPFSKQFDQAITDRLNSEFYDLDLR